MSKKLNPFEWKNQIIDNANSFTNLLNINETTGIYREKSNEILETLCKIKPGLAFKPNGTKTCRFCFYDFAKDPENKLACKCYSFHKKCFFDECVKTSKDFNENELEKLNCVECRGKISLATVEQILGDDYRKEKRRIEEIKNRKVKCCICKAEEKFDKMHERHCGHGFCKGCFKNYLDNLIKRHRGNIRDFICTEKNCVMPGIDFDEIKLYVDKSILNYSDDYLEKIYDPKKQNNLIFKCKSAECFSVKVTNIDCKDQEYVCMKCDEEKNEPVRKKVQEEHKG